MSQLDPRRYAYRQDLAAESLRNMVRVPRYVLGEIHQVEAASAPLRREPRKDAPLDTEVLHGEYATVYEIASGWAWVQLRMDGYVGYVPADCLGPVRASPTHRVTGLRTFVFPKPDIKAPPKLALSFGAQVTGGNNGQFLALDTGGYIPIKHVLPVGVRIPDFVACAERFVGVPYLWGGKTSLGIDCSGLVQLTMQAAGHFCPRDTYMQAAEVGFPLPGTDIKQLKRGDLVFWKGHVGIMTSPDLLLHANAHHMEVVTEPLAIAVVRTAAAGNPVTALKRPAGLSSPV